MKATLVASILLMGILAPCKVMAQDAVEYLSNSEEPKEEWIVTFERGAVKFNEARISREADKLRLTSYLRGPSAETLSTGVVVTRQGEVISLPLHTVFQDEMTSESQIAAERKKGELQRRIMANTEKIRELEGKMELLNTKKRMEAGFGKVDRTYEKISNIEEQLKVLREAQGEYTAD
ncbi:MAG: hypothetical protein KDD53_06500 [Bdellovibrionales bacterium]|nr:hypothetical protein [Bdellovibrionales bacterium]